MYNDLNSDLLSHLNDGITKLPQITYSLQSKTYNDDSNIHEKKQVKADKDNLVQTQLSDFANRRSRSLGT